MVSLKQVLELTREQELVQMPELLRERAPQPEPELGLEWVKELAP